MAKGRPRKLGNDKCPDPECSGYLQLGRVRQKVGRNRPTGRYVERDWFRHNDDCVHPREHYIDNFTHPPAGKKNFFQQSGDDYLRIAHGIKEISKRIATFPLTEKELDDVCQKAIWARHNIVEPISILADIQTGLLKLPLQATEQLKDIILQNILSDKNLFGRGYQDLYLKYDRPLRLERNKKRNQKLKQWEGRKTNDYTGIFVETPTKA